MIDSPPVTDRFKTFIVWQNQLVALSDRNLFFYNPKEGGRWSMKETQVLPSLFESKFFFGANNHLCLEGRVPRSINTWQQWCLGDPAESTVWSMLETPHMGRNTPLGTLSAKIISSMVEANKGN